MAAGEEIRLLRPDEWPAVAPVVRGDFKDAMPTDPAQAGFLAAVEGGRVAGFVHVEVVYHFVSLYVEPARRRTRLARRLVEEAAALIPAGWSAVVLTDSPGVERALVRLGAEARGQFRLLRKDF